MALVPLVVGTAAGPFPLGRQVSKRFSIKGPPFLVIHGAVVTGVFVWAIGLSNMVTIGWALPWQIITGSLALATAVGLISRLTNQTYPTFIPIVGTIVVIAMRVWNFAAMRHADALLDEADAPSEPPESPS